MNKVGYRLKSLINRYDKARTSLYKKVFNALGFEGSDEKKSCSCEGGMNPEYIFEDESSNIEAVFEKDIGTGRSKLIYFSIEKEKASCEED